MPTSEQQAPVAAEASVIQQTPDAVLPEHSDPLSASGELMDFDFEDFLDFNDSLEPLPVLEEASIDANEPQPTNDPKPHDHDQTAPEQPQADLLPNLNQPAQEHVMAQDADEIEPELDSMAIDPALLESYLTDANSTNIDDLFGPSCPGSPIALDTDVPSFLVDVDAAESDCIHPSQLSLDLSHGPNNDEQQLMGTVNNPGVSDETDGGLVVDRTGDGKDDTPSGDRPSRNVVVSSGFIFPAAMSEVDTKPVVADVSDVMGVDGTLPSDAPVTALKSETGPIDSQIPNFQGIQLPEKFLQQIMPSQYSHSANVNQLQHMPLQWFAVKGEENIMQHADQKSFKSDSDDSDSDGEEIKSFYPTHPRPAAWGPSYCQNPVFRYSSRGQWSEGTYFSTQALQFYMARCPRNLTVWLQSNPRIGQRQDEWDRMCRWKDCPDKGNPIRPGFFRCTFDEYSHLTTEDEKDPFFVAGSMHLYCFEQVFDAAKLLRRKRLVPDQRVFKLEAKKNPMKLNRPPNTLIVEGAIMPWVASQPDTHHVPASQWTPRRHEESLGYAMTNYYVSFFAPDRVKDNDDVNPNVLSTVKHLGNLQLFVDFVKTRKDQKRHYPAAKVPRKPMRRDSISSLSELDEDFDDHSRTRYASDSEDDKEPDDADEEPNVHVIQEILGTRHRRGRETEYEVKWQGHKTTTWEPASSIRKDLSKSEIDELLSSNSNSQGKSSDARFKALEQRIEKLMNTIQSQQHELRRSRKRGDASGSDTELARNSSPKRHRGAEGETSSKRKRSARAAKKPVRYCESDSESEEEIVVKRKRASKDATSSNKRRKISSRD
ncbi:hypothetical protein NLU13_2583 [Sarocladium strictum]|uniref:Chromo domain-containing protein n=1 Tax=Sarocladium strictum TaxID=5046 RepID=A0AA39GL50_SARSR|nr:hypothetical protein NLU13_2583 [Sarocladium strictum]